MTEVKDQEKKGFFSRLKSSLTGTSGTLVKKIDRAVLGKKNIDDDLIEELEEILIGADVGVKTTYDILESVGDRMRRRELGDADALKAAIKSEILGILQREESNFSFRPEGPTVMMVVGVNGVGKTTTIGKLALRYKREGKNVLIAAGDTFRAAAIEQLQIWAQRAGIDIIKHHDGADPAAVAYDSIEAARARGVDLLIVDTAGRLHTKINLMEELKKIKRVMTKVIPDAPHEILLVVDATTGQNAISQAKLFNESVGLTGLAVTKLDGTPRGGVIIAIADELDIPIRYIGVGEGVDDLRDFNAAEFVDAIF